MLRHEVGARYKRVKKIPFLGNTDRCLILRQKYAMFMISQLAKGVRVLNLDQTWLNDIDFTRRKWRQMNAVNSSPIRRLSPRISVMMAVDTDGKLYSSLSQVNTDHKTFCLFVTMLAAKLSQEDPNWREKTLLLIDGAQYQTCPESIRHMRAQGYQICVSAPYSFASASIEYVFSALKASSMHAGNLKFGKR